MASVEFPLAARELTKSGKAKSTYFIRAFVVGMILVFAFGLANISPTSAGSELVGLITFCQLLACCLLPVALTAESVAGEKRDHTLQYLILADRGGIQVLAAKFLAAFLHVELVLVSALPMLAIASFLGGVDVPVEAVRLAMMTLMAATGCVIGLLASTLSARPISALSCGLVMVFFWQAPTAWIDLRSAGVGAPQYPLNPAMAVFSLGIPGRPLMSLLPCALLTACVGILAMALAMHLLPRQVHGKGRPSTRSRRTRRRHVLQERILLNGPAAHIVAYSTSGWFERIPRGLGRSTAAVALLAVAAFPVAGWLLVLLQLHYDVASSFRELRRSLTIDELELTPITPKHLASAIVRGMMYRCLAYVPAVLVIGFPLPLLMTALERPEVLAMDFASWASMTAIGFEVIVTVNTCALFYFTIALACALACTFDRASTAVLALMGLGLSLTLRFFLYVGCLLALQLPDTSVPTSESALQMWTSAALFVVASTCLHMFLARKCQAALTSALHRARQ